MMNSLSKIVQNLFDCTPVVYRLAVHKFTDFAYNKSQVRSNDKDILKISHNTLVHGGIGENITKELNERGK